MDNEKIKPVLNGTAEILRINSVMRKQRSLLTDWIMILAKQVKILP